MAERIKKETGAVRHRMQHFVQFMLASISKSSGRNNEASLKQVSYVGPFMCFTGHCHVCIQYFCSLLQKNERKLSSAWECNGGIVFARYPYNSTECDGKKLGFFPISLRRLCSEHPQILIYISSKCSRYIVHTHTIFVFFREYAHPHTVHHAHTNISTLCDSIR